MGGRSTARSPDPPVLLAHRRALVGSAGSSSAHARPQSAVAHLSSTCAPPPPLAKWPPAAQSSCRPRPRPTCRPRRRVAPGLKNLAGTPRTGRRGSTSPIACGCSRRSRIRAAVKVPRLGKTRRDRRNPRAASRSSAVSCPSVIPQLPPWCSSAPRIAPRGSGRVPSVLPKEPIPVHHRSVASATICW